MRCIDRPPRVSGGGKVHDGPGSLRALPNAAPDYLPQISFWFGRNGMGVPELRDCLRLRRRAIERRKPARTAMEASSGNTERTGP
jgi:hypothetical protein